MRHDAFATPVSTVLLGLRLSLLARAADDDVQAGQHLHVIGVAPEPLGLPADVLDVLPHHLDGRRVQEDRLGVLRRELPAPGRRPYRREDV